VTITYWQYDPYLWVIFWILYSIVLAIIIRRIIRWGKR
jgi:hypothetical protein